MKNVITFKSSITPFLFSEVKSTTYFCIINNRISTLTNNY